MHLIKLNLLVGFLFLIFWNTQAQININSNPYWEGIVELTDGSKKQGFIQVPNSISQRRIAYKTSMNGKKDKLKEKHIISIQVTSPNGKEYLFERLPLVMTIKGNASLGQQIVLVAAKNNYATIYVVHGVYNINTSKNEIEMLYRYEQGKDFATTAYYIRKKDRKKGNLLFISRNIAGFKKGLNYHLTEDKKLLSSINNGELKADDMPEIINTYMETTSEL